MKEKEKENIFGDLLNKFKQQTSEDPLGKVSRKDIIDIKCSGCGLDVFDRLFKVLKIPKDKTVDKKKDQYLNIPVYVCAGCGQVLDVSK